MITTAIDDCIKIFDAEIKDFAITSSNVKNNWDENVKNLFNPDTISWEEETIDIKDNELTGDAKYKFIYIDRTSSKNAKRCQTEVNFLEE